MIEEGWAIKSAGGCLFLGSISRRRSEAIKEVIAESKHSWRYWRDHGFRAVRVQITDELPGWRKCCLCGTQFKPDDTQAGVTKSFWDDSQDTCNRCGKKVERGEL